MTTTNYGQLDQDTVPLASPSLGGEIETITANPAKQLKRRKTIARFEPFPIEALPEPLASFVRAGAAAIGCAAAYIAVPLLAALAGAIGNSRRIVIKSGWCPPPITWAVIVGESGTSKTPAFDLATKFARQAEIAAHREWQESMKEFGFDILHYEKSLAEWKKKASGSPPEKPVQPPGKQFVISDTTVEALIDILLCNPKGVFLCRDELAGLLGAFDRYAGGKGADAAHYLSMHGGGLIKYNRKTNGQRVIVPSAAVSIAGGIQPKILRRTLSGEHTESGFAARLLMVFPPRREKKWTDEEICEELEDSVAAVFQRLYQLEMELDDQAEPKSVCLGMTAQAKRAFLTYYAVHNREQVELTGPLAAAWSKLEEYAARFALIIYLCRQAAEDPALCDQDCVDDASMVAAISLAEWFKAEAKRVYAVLTESEDGEAHRSLCEWIERKGGKVTVRDLYKGMPAQHPDAESAERALNELAEVGEGQWHDVPAGNKGGRPTRVFVLGS